jgi:hypothetical protein
VPLESHEGITDARHPTQFACRVLDTPVLEFEKVRQLGLIQFAHAFPHILREHEIEEGGELGIESIEDRGAVRGQSARSGLEKILVDLLNMQDLFITATDVVARHKARKLDAIDQDDA